MLWFPVLRQGFFHRCKSGQLKSKQVVWHKCKGVRKFYKACNAYILGDGNGRLLRTDLVYTLQHSRITIAKTIKLRSGVGNQDRKLSNVSKILSVRWWRKRIDMKMLRFVAEWNTHRITPALASRHTRCVRKAHECRGAGACAFVGQRSTRYKYRNFSQHFSIEEIGLRTTFFYGENQRIKFEIDLWNQAIYTPYNNT